jgi:hypothetical protein
MNAPTPTQLARARALEAKAAAGLVLQLLSATVQNGAIVISYAVTEPRLQKPGWPKLVVYLFSADSLLAGPDQVFGDATGGRVRVTLPVEPDYDRISGVVYDVQGRRSVPKLVKIARP